MKRIAHIIAFAFAALSAAGADLVPPLVDNDTKDLAFPTNRALLSTAEKASLTGGGASTDHYHASDRDRSNHTGTQAWSTISSTPTTLSGYGITDAQPLDADLTALAGLSYSNGDIAYRSGGTFARLAHPGVSGKTIISTNASEIFWGDPPAGGAAGETWNFYPPTASALHTLGDSITAGYTATDRTNRWAAKLAGLLGLSLTNLAYSSSTVPDAAWQAFPGFTYTNTGYSDPQVYSLSSVAMNNMFGLLIGFNDLRDFGTNSTRIAAYERGLGAVVGYLGLGTSRIRTAQSASTSGIWTASSWYGGSMQRLSTNIGATLTWTNVNSDVIYVCYEDAGHTTSGVFTVSIDGYSSVATSVTATNGYGNRAYRNGSDTNIPPTTGPYGDGKIDFMPSILRLTGLGSGPHSVTVTVSTGPIRINWLGIPPGYVPGDETGPYVYVGVPIQQATWSGSGSDAAAAMFAASVRKVASRLRNDGLKVRVVPTDTKFDRLTEISGDTVHPNDAGQLKIAQTFYEQMGSDTSAFGAMSSIVGSRSMRASELDVSSPTAATSRFGGAPWQASSAITLSYADPTLSRRMTITGNGISVTDASGAAQGVALASAGANATVLGGTGFGLQLGANGPIITSGSGSPEGAVTAATGSLYVNTSGGASTTLYVKTSGSGNTGWTAK